MRYYTYDIIVGNGYVPVEALSKEEREKFNGYPPSELDREINLIYSSKTEEVVNMTITPIMDADDTIAVGYHIIYTSIDK